MWKLAPPDIASVEQQLNTALTYANGSAVYALTPDERAAVLTVYANYQALGGMPSGILLPDELDAGCNTALSNAYNEVQTGGRLKDFRSLLLAAAPTCPFCGFGEVTQLDHF